MTPRYGRGLVVALESRGQLNPGPMLTPYLATLTLLIRTQAAPLPRPTPPSEPTRVTASRSICSRNKSRGHRCSTRGRASGRSRQHTLAIPRGEGTGQRVVLGDQSRQVDVDERAALNAHAPIDDAEVNRGRLAENQRGKGIVDSAPGEGQCVEAVADEVRGHAGREVANVVATKHGGTAPGSQPERLTGAHGAACLLVRRARARPSSG